MARSLAHTGGTMPFDSVRLLRLSCGSSIARREAQIDDCAYRELLEFRCAAPRSRNTRVLDRPETQPGTRHFAKHNSQAPNWARTTESRRRRHLIFRTG